MDIEADVTMQVCQHEILVENSTTVILSLGIFDSILRDSLSLYLETLALKMLNLSSATFLCFVDLALAPYVLLSYVSRF